jgi:hypothetical protein
LELSPGKYLAKCRIAFLQNSKMVKIGTTIKNTLTSVKTSLQLLFEKLTSEHTQKIAFSSVILTTTVSVLFISAVLMYSVIYNITIPTVKHSVPIYLDYSQPVPIAAVETSLMQLNQKYTIGLELNVPETEQNLNLGNFMVGIKLSNTDKTLSLQKPCHLKYKSPLLRSISTIVNLYSLIFSNSLESHSVYIPLIFNHLNKDQGPQKIEIMVNESRLHTYGAFIVFDVEFQGLAYFMHYWFFTTGLLAVLNIMFVEALVFTYFWNFLQSILEDEESEKVGDEDENDTIYGSSSRELLLISPTVTQEDSRSQTSENSIRMMSSNVELRKVRDSIQSIDIRRVRDQNIRIVNADPVDFDTNFGAYQRRLLRNFSYTQKAEREFNDFPDDNDFSTYENASKEDNSELNLRAEDNSELLNHIYDNEIDFDGLLGKFVDESNDGIDSDQAVP